jgi:hypothetical protein
MIEAVQLRCNKFRTRLLFSSTTKLQFSETSPKRTKILVTTRCLFLGYGIVICQDGTDELDIFMGHFFV